MSKVKLAIVYYSSTGVNYQLAQWAAEGGKQADADVKLLRVEEIASPVLIEANPKWKAHLEATREIPIATADDIVAADAIIFSTPTRFGNIAAQMKMFLDTTGKIWFSGQTVNKVVSAMTSASNVHGGQETTVVSLYTTMYHWGAVVVAPGYTDQSLYAAGGNPYGVSVSTDELEKKAKEVRAAVQHQAKRVVAIAEALKRGLRSDW
ncbi:NAD(P)H:quinone oxidoreductase [Cohnella thailandensis]|uniref:NAD(P)H:quinone oxidoreductase n=1 Tax=Cohnella thailandensis TaxID=557557 RepID=A0A841ST26_9BACL|nr:NAD(P)H:quinone oxidoreductase [Cohnella thailandensis]MBB6633368.1 NAD(P)H:quinone oxidoreductase [Cohnella thailandensis]MBP1977289.1 NAD(P)H dehydrogenase (quinone) [Cohnella thailandensis]